VDKFKLNNTGMLFDAKQDLLSECGYGAVVVSLSRAFLGGKRKIQSRVGNMLFTSQNDDNTSSKYPTGTPIAQVSRLASRTSKKQNAVTNGR